MLTGLLLVIGDRSYITHILVLYRRGQKEYDICPWQAYEMKDIKREKQDARVTVAI